MIFTIIIAVASLLILIILHELGHFLMAKKFGVRVEEFGIGIPPRIFGKKIGETIYSVNLIPVGAFVRIYGEEERISDPRSFTSKPFWQKALIILGGVLVFWIVAAVLLTVVMGIGTPTLVSDEESRDLKDPKVQILSVSPGSPAQAAGLKMGDAVKNVKTRMALPDGRQEDVKIVDKVKDVQEFVEENKGKEIVLTIQRGQELFDVALTPRAVFPEGEGPTGVSLIRTALKSYPWYQAPFQGIMATGYLTIATVKGLATTIVSLVSGRGVPAGVELRGPVGIVEFFSYTRTLGVSYLLQLIAVISIFLALFNVLPIPALDGGKLMFLIIEAVRRKPNPPKIEKSLTAIFFVLLILLIFFVTFKDIQRLF